MSCTRREKIPGFFPLLVLLLLLLLINGGKRNHRSWCQSFAFRQCVQAWAEVGGRGHSSCLWLADRPHLKGQKQEKRKLREGGNTWRHRGNMGGIFRADWFLSGLLDFLSACFSARPWCVGFTQFVSWQRRMICMFLELETGDETTPALEDLIAIPCDYLIISGNHSLNIRSFMSWNE